MKKVIQIVRYELEIYKKPTKYSFQSDSFEIDYPKILAQNEKYIVFNDSFFTKIEKNSRDSCVLYSVLNKPSVSFRRFDHDGFFFTLYSEKKKSFDWIKAHIKAVAEKKYGWIVSDDIDFSVIDSYDKK